MVVKEDGGVVDGRETEGWNTHLRGRDKPGLSNVATHIPTAFLACSLKKSGGGLGMNGGGLGTRLGEAWERGSIDLVCRDWAEVTTWFAIDTGKRSCKT